MIPQQPHFHSRADRADWQNDLLSSQAAADELSASVVQIVVVRIEVESGVNLEGQGGEAMAKKAADRILDSTTRPGIAARQAALEAT